MSLFHKSKIQVPEKSLDEQLIEAKAKLARYKHLPDDDFTVRLGQTSLLIRYGVDEKPRAIARVEAKIAELEVRLARLSQRDEAGGERKI